ncbi:MAG: hypothetical protein AAF989_13055 [Planctomycetota bacterium]
MLQVSTPPDEESGEHPQGSDFERTPGIPPAAQNPGMAVGEEQVDSEALTEASAILNEGKLGSEPSDGEFPGGWGTSGFATADSEPDSVPGNVSYVGADVADGKEDSPPVGWESVRTARSRQIALVMFTLVSGLCVAVLLFVLFVRAWQEPQGQEVVDSSVVETAETGTVAESEEMQSDLNNTGDSEDPEGQTEPLPDPSLTTETPVDLPAMDADVDGADSSAIIDALDVLGTGEGDAVADEAPVVVPEQSGNATPIVIGERAGEQAATSKPMMELDPDLKLLKPFLLDLSSPAPDRPEQLQPLVTRDDIILDRAADASLDPMMIANPPSAINTRQSLGVEFGVARPAEFPVGNFLLLVSQMTAVPIEIDWVSFNLVGKDADFSVKMLQEPANASAHLDSVVEQVGGVLQTEESLLRITISETTFGEAIGPLTDTSDFGEHQRSADELLDAFLQRKAESPVPQEDSDDVEVADGAPDEGVVTDQWREKRGDDQLAVVATEAMRRMRGLPGKMNERFFRRFATTTAGPIDDFDWPVVDSGEAGTQQVTAQPMAQWIGQLAQRNSSVAMVNWSDASKRQMAPHQLVMPHSGDGFLSMVDATLEPFQVKIRVVDEGLWWIGTDGRYDRLPVIAWTPELGDQKETLVANLDRTFGLPDGRAYRRAYDEKSDRLLLMLPRFILRQFDRLE